MYKKYIVWQGRLGVFLWSQDKDDLYTAIKCTNKLHVAILNTSTKFIPTVDTAGVLLETDSYEDAITEYTLYCL